jgi:hypothetical protein
MTDAEHADAVRATLKALNETVSSARANGLRIVVEPNTTTGDIEIRRIYRCVEF